MLNEMEVTDEEVTQFVQGGLVKAPEGAVFQAEPWKVHQG